MTRNTAPEMEDLQTLKLNNQKHGAEDGIGKNDDNQNRGAEDDHVEYTAPEMDDLSSLDLDDQDNGADDGRPADARPPSSRRLRICASFADAKRPGRRRR